MDLEEDNMDEKIVLEMGDVVEFNDENGHYAWYNDCKEALEHAGYIITVEEVA